MEQNDPLALSIIFLDGYDAAQGGEHRCTNPYRGSLATIWFEGWDEGEAVRYWIGQTSERLFQSIDTVTTLVAEDAPHAGGPLMEQDRPTANFTEGYASGRVGAQRTENPYETASANAEQWLKGWDEGAAKRAVVNAKPDPDTPADG